MIKKFILSLLILCSLGWAAEEPSSNKAPAKAVIASTSAASATAWASLSISFMVVLGIIIATAIQKSKN